MKRIYRVLPTIFFFLLAPMLAAQAQAPLKKTLSNGLTVLVQENRAAPVVAVRIYVKTGSIYEGKFLGSGISHLFEHTLFEGTKTRSKKQLNDEIQAIGGQSNAYTSYDVTCYYITTASPYFQRALELLADMTQNATFPAAEVKVQQGVIHNEMNLGADDPDRALSELYNRTAFRVHPVRLPIIGYREQFDRLTRDDIVSYYNSHYTPVNSILSIAGDISANQVFAAAEKAFGNWQRQAPDTPTLPQEPYQNSMRRAVVERDVQSGYLQLGWHTIPLQHPDLYALDTLAQVLGGGASSRLVREIQEKQNLVTSIAAYSSTPNYNAGVFAVRSNVPPQNLRRAQDAILAEVTRIQRDGVTAEELQRAKNQIRSSFIFNSQGVENQAEQTAYDEMGTGDPAYSRRYVTRIMGVTAPEVMEMARKYLRPDGLTVALLQPRTAVVAATAATPVAVVPPATMVRLSNGLRVVMRQNKSAPTVSAVVMGRGGVRVEPNGKAGVANATTAMLTRGTKTRTAEAIASLVDNLGGSLDGFSGYNAWGMRSQWLAADWRRGLTLMAESLLQPTFLETELDRVKAQTLAAISDQQDDPMSSAALLLRSTFYGAHPYARNRLGSTYSVSRLKQADLVEYWSRVLRPEDMVIGVFGDIDPVQVQATLEFLLGKVKASGARYPDPAPVKVPTELATNTLSKKGISQVALWYGFASTDVKSEDRYAVNVLDAALSGADLPGGRLHARLRDNELVYVVHAYDQPGVDQGMFVVYAATTPGNKEKVEAAVKEELAKVRDTQITEAELERAKSMAVAAFAIDGQTNGAQAQTAVSDELFGLGFRKGNAYVAGINAVTLADVQRVAKRYLVDSASALAIVQPENGAA